MPQHASAVTAPATSVKLISAQYQFATDLSTKLAGCLELTHFTVVGVLGFEGVGKSTLLSLLHSSSQQQQSLPARPTKGPASRTTTTASPSSRSSMFATQSMETLLTGDYETRGVDLAVSHDATGAVRSPSLVLLDTQPMLSSAMLCDALSKSESQQRFGALTPEQQVEVHSLQLATFLVSVCHYVVIAHDALADRDVVRFLELVDARLNTCRLPNISGSVKDKHVAKLLFVATQLSDAALLYKEQALLTRHVRALERAWPSAFYRTTRPVSLFGTLRQEAGAVILALLLVLIDGRTDAPLVRTMNVRAALERSSDDDELNEQEAQIPVFVLPHKPAKAARAHSHYEDYDGACVSISWVTISCVGRYEV